MLSEKINFNQTATINIAQLPNGIYECVILNEKGALLSSQKLIKE
jgi:hypothetical protein